MKPIELVLERLEQVGCRPRPSGSGWEALCSGHELDGGQHRPSLSVGVGGDERVLLSCHRGCDLGAILGPLDLTPGDLFVKQEPRSSNGRRVVEVFDYRDEHGALLFQVVRFEPKSFAQRRHDPGHPDADRDGYVWKLGDTRRVVYRLPELRRAAEFGAIVFLTEGERHVDALVALGLTATTSPMGAGKWRDEYSECFRGIGCAVVLPDDDEEGRKHARTVASSLAGVVADVRVLELFERGETKRDVLDWLALAQSGEEREQAKGLLLGMVKTAPKASDFVAGLEEPGPVGKGQVRATAADRGLDDIGNAARFVDQHAAALRYVPAWVRWLRWDGHRWAEDDVLEHLRRAKLTARALADEAGREPDETRRKELLGHARRSAAEPRLRAMLTTATSDERLIVRPAELDRGPWALSTESGVVDLRTGELRPHRPEDHLTMLAGAAYRPDAPAPRWQAHLRRCLVTVEMITFLQRLAGLSALGLTREHVLPILYGGGANGKSVTRNAIAAALGDYAHQSSIDLLLQTGRSPGQATPELADLRGRRLVTVSETPEDGRLASERVKAISGGEPITARRLHGNPFTFEPSHTIWLSTNHKPRIRDDGDAIWRRVLLVPFGVTIPDAEQDRELGEKLAAERVGILRWIVDGARAYLRDGLSPPPAVKLATAGYRADEDYFAAFLAERTVAEDGASAQAAELLRAFNAWAEQAGAPGLSVNALAEKLYGRGLTRKREKSGSRWHGLRLVQEGTLDA